MMMIIIIIFMMMVIVTMMKMRRRGGEEEEGYGDTNQDEGDCNCDDDNDVDNYKEVSKRIIREFGFIFLSRHLEMKKKYSKRS